MKNTYWFVVAALLVGIINIGLISFLIWGKGGGSTLATKEKENPNLIRGSLVFQTYCVLCHGEKADGKGRLAVGKTPPPANLTKSFLTDEQKRVIIRGGGASVGRSEFMPPWGGELSEGQIEDLIFYTNAIKTK